MRFLWSVVGDAAQYCIVAILWLIGATTIAGLINWLVFYSANWRMSVVIGCVIMTVITIAAMFQQRR